MPPGTPRRPRQQGWPPRWLTTVPAADLKRSRGLNVIEVAERLCRITKDSVAGNAGELMTFRPWQAELTRQLLAVRADGRLRHRSALIGLPRKNGKSSWLAVIALDHLLFGPGGAEVYSCAADRDQARLVFGTVKRMVELDSELSSLLTMHRDAVYNPHNGAVYRCLSAEAYTKEGLNPTLVCFDEVHAQPSRELWDVMALAMGARTEPLLVGITTAGVRTDSSGRDSLCYSMYQYGRRVASGEVDDPTFFFAWWEAADGADHRDPKTWKTANPAYGDLVAVEDFGAAVLRTPESEFRIKRVNQWVSGMNAWLPVGAWEACKVQRSIPDGSRVVLGFDGSYRGDSTALVAVEVSDSPPHIQVAGLWERPENASQDWAVPVMEVEQAIRNACVRWNVAEIACDPYRWARSYQVLEAEGLPVVEFPQNASRMVPATQRFHEAVANHALTHDGDPRLARHISNCVLKIDQRGSRLAKETKWSQRRIDLAVAAVMAVARAAWHASTPDYDLLDSVL